MTRILVLLLAILVLPACSTLPERVAEAAYPKDYWYSYVDWERGFSVDAPGRLAIREAAYITAGAMAPQSYTINRGTLRFSIVAVERRPGDQRSHYELAAANGFDLMEWDRVRSTLPTFQRHVYFEGKLYRQRLVVTNRMVYELLVSGPADVFPDFAARRFLDSFIVMVKT